MALGPRLTQKQNLQLAVTQKMQQSLAILRMSNQELTAFLENEYNSNPLMQIMPPAGGQQAQSMGSAGADALIAETVVQPETLLQHLQNLLAFVDPGPVNPALLELLLGELDDSGFLRSTLDELSGHYRRPVEELDAALKIIQQLEPAGVGARNLKECLALQLKSVGQYNDHYAALLDLLNTRNQSPEIMAKTLQLSLSEVKMMLARIKSLSLDPAAAFNTEIVNFAKVDVIFGSNSDGTIRVELNTDAFPKVLQNDEYLADLPKNGTEAKIYISQCSSRISWLSNALRKRANTILKIAVAIASKQAEYFEKGPSGLAPMNLIQIAETTGLHQSTVSRATAGKWYSCQFGDYPLRSLFSSALNGADNSSISSTRVQYTIRKLIDNEKPNSILSDRKIAIILESQGILIARRTIAKYRILMNIPKSTIRRSQKIL